MSDEQLPGANMFRLPPRPEGILLTITKRELFAAMAMQGLMAQVRIAGVASKEQLGLTMLSVLPGENAIARASTLIADALLAELAGKLCQHVWETKSCGGSPSEPTEYVTVCKECGAEKTE